MKRVIVIVVVVVIAVAAWYERQALLRWYHTVVGLKPVVKLNQTIEEVRQDVLTPPPLKNINARFNGTLTVTGVIAQTNLQRQQNGNEPPLTENSKLDATAKAKLTDMFAKQYFEHESPTGKGPADLAKNAGYEYVTIGENLALGNFKDDADLVAAWMNSPGHRANILNSKYTEIGVAVGKGIYEGKQVWMAVQEFGRPLSDCPEVSTPLKSQINTLRSQVQSLEDEVNTLKAELEQQDPKTRKEVEEYNEKVQTYNDLVNSYNNKIDLLKQATALYNSQVKAFNACVGS